MKVNFERLSFVRTLNRAVLAESKDLQRLLVKAKLWRAGTMYKEFSQGDGNNHPINPELLKELIGTSNGGPEEVCPVHESETPSKVIGTKKVLTRKGNHIGESMKLSSRRQRILDVIVDRGLSELEEKYDRFTTNDSLKKSSR